MPRINRVKKSRKDVGSCNRCGKSLPVGSAYIWWKFRYGGARTRCTDAACAPRSSDLTSSGKLSALYSYQEDAQDNIAAAAEHSDIQAAMEDLANGVNEVAEEYRESAENIREHFSESATADECEEKADELENWANEIECHHVDEDEDLEDAKGSAVSVTEECPL